MHTPTDPPFRDEHGRREWQANGVLHRDDDLPAVEHPSCGMSEWWFLGHRHRDGGLPAVVNGTSSWVSPFAFRPIYQGYAKRVNNTPSCCRCVPEHGTCEWWANDTLHRDGDLPAVVKADGTQEWWAHNRCHRDNGQPAVVLPCGTRKWYVGGFLHRNGNLPAVEDADGSQEWWVSGLRHLDCGDQPAHILPSGTRVWYTHGRVHRAGDNPAVEGADGTCEWFVEGLRHRDGDQPAVMRPDGTWEWWQNGTYVRGQCVAHFTAGSIRLAFVEATVALSCGMAGLALPPPGWLAECILSDGMRMCVSQSPAAPFGTAAEYALMVALFL